MPQIEAKIAVRRAREYMIELLGREPENLTLEEVELSEDEQFWFITLGFQETGKGTMFPISDKKYKIFKIRSDNGNVVSMKIREIAKV